jgi:hypothetical protein
VPPQGNQSFLSIEITGAIKRPPWRSSAFLTRLLSPPACALGMTSLPRQLGVATWRDGGFRGLVSASSAGALLGSARSVSVPASHQPRSAHSSRTRTCDWDDHQCQTGATVTGPMTPSSHRARANAKGWHRPRCLTCEIGEAEGYVAAVDLHLGQHGPELELGPRKHRSPGGERMGQALGKGDGHDAPRSAGT